jgi:uncharacterized protein YndB with AHSA1/START domain
MASPLTSSIDIAKPPGILWKLLTDVEQINDWYDDWDAVDYIRPQGILRVGSTFRLLRRDTSAWCHVTIADPPQRLRWLEIADDWAAVAVEFSLTPDATGGTVLTHTKTVIDLEALPR